MPTNAIATVLQDYVSTYAPGRLDATEQRPSNYAALDMIKKQTAGAQSILDPAVKAQIDRGFNLNIKVPVVNYQDVAIGNVRTCALQAGGITTALVTLTAITYAFGFIGYPMQHYENLVSYQTATAKMIDAGLQKMASTIDGAVVNFVDTNKNQHWPAEILDFYAETGDALQVPQASKNDFYNQAGAILQTMDFPTDGIDVLTNPRGMPMINRLSAQGSGNATNEAFQFLGYTWWPTSRVVNGSGVEATHYLIAPNSLAVASRNSPDAKQRSRVHESKYWDIFPNAPYIGMDLDVFYQADCADASAIQAASLAKFTQTKVESWQFAVDVFYLKFYNSDPATRFSPIVKAEILEA